MVKFWVLCGHLQTKFLFLTCLHPDDRESVVERMQRCKTEDLPLDAEYRLVARSGRVVWVHDVAVPVRDDDGVSISRQGYVIDVSERRAIEAQRDQLLTRERAQNERLRELDRLKDEFVALVSHELRTPLTSIRGYLELVLDDAEAGGDIRLGGRLERFPQQQWSARGILTQQVIQQRCAGPR